MFNKNIFFLQSYTVGVVKIQYMKLHLKYNQRTHAD